MRKTIYWIISLLSLALVSYAAWIVELLFFHGWKGTVWIENGIVSIHVVFCAAGVSILLGEPMQIVPVLQRGLRVVAVIVFVWFSLLLGSESVITGFLRMNFYGYSSWLHLSHLNMPPLLFIVAGAGMGLLGCVFGFRLAYRMIPGWSWLFFLIALFFIIPLSVATIHIIPASHHETDLIHAVKMGYPAFWSVLLIGIASRLSLIIPKRPGLAGS